MDKLVIKEKKIEAVIGLLFTLPAVIGIICFLLNFLFGEASLEGLDGIWGVTENYSGWDNSSYGYAASSPTPLFMGLLAIVGGYLLKGNLHYLLKEKKKPQETNNKQN